jgi:hypothetical protein
MTQRKKPLKHQFGTRSELIFVDKPSGISTHAPDLDKLGMVELLQMELGQHYYRLAARFLHEHTFKSERHYDAWDAFSQGMTYRQIGMQIGCSHVMAYKIVSQLLAGPFDRYLKAALSSDPDELEIPPKGRGAA